MLRETFGRSVVLTLWGSAATLSTRAISETLQMCSFAGRPLPAGVREHAAAAGALQAASSFAGARTFARCITFPACIICACIALCRASCAIHL